MLFRDMANFLGLDGEPEWKKFLFRWMSLSLVFHLVTAVFSIGHHSADEYFQILEFVSFRLGNTPANVMPVELHEHMRQWMQPGIYWCITQVLQFLGDSNPFHWAISYRIFSGLFGWVSTVGLALCSRFWFPEVKTQRIAVMALALIWFFPCFHVRPSSESLAGSSFIIGLCIAFLTWRQNHQKKNWAWSWGAAGIFLGLSFEFRFQMGFMIFGIFAWLLVFGYRTGRLPLRSLAALVSSSALVFLLGRSVDWWGYHQWVFSPWNYFSYNLVRGEVSKYGTAPWWDVFRMSMTETWPVLGFLMAISIVIAWVRHPRHILTWSQVPFFIVHEMIAHKECRFFFPIACAGPILILLSLCSTRTVKLLTFSKTKSVATVWNWTWKFLVLNNLIALVVLMFVPFARVVQFYEGVYDLIPNGAQKFELFFNDRDPYILLGNPIYFYRPHQLVTTKFTHYSELKDIILKRSEPLWLFDTQFHLGSEADPVRPFCKPVYQTFSANYEKINWGNWLDRTLTWTLYRCEKTGS